MEITVTSKHFLKVILAESSSTSRKTFNHEKIQSNETVALPLAIHDNKTCL